MAKHKSEPTKDAGTIEYNLKLLESLVTKLEQGDISLADSLSNFHKGVDLVRESQAIIESADQVVQTLTESEGKLPDGSNRSGDSKE